MTTNTHFENKEHYLAFRKAWSNAVNSKKAITPAHHVLYNILRGRDYDRGFTLITNRNKLANGMSPNFGLVQAVSHLNRIKKYPDYLEEFLTIFEGTVTAETVLDIKFPECKQLYMDYGPGTTIIPLLISGEAKARTQSDLETLLKEVA